MKDVSTIKKLDKVLSSFPSITESFNLFGVEKNLESKNVHYDNRTISQILRRLFDDDYLDVFKKDCYVKGCKIENVCHYTLNVKGDLFRGRNNKGYATQRKKELRKNWPLEHWLLADAMKYLAGALIGSVITAATLLTCTPKKHQASKVKYPSQFQDIRNKILKS